MASQCSHHSGKPSNADASAVAYPPYPSRLLKAGSSGQLPAATGTVHQPRQQQQRDAYVPPAARRVRPIAVAPPPGLGGSVLDQQQRAHSMQHFNTAPLQQQQPPLAASTDLFAPAGFAQASAGGYSALVKFRAIAGALAGDWSSGYA